MRKEKAIEVGVINITIHPHSPERYIELFENLYNQEPVKIRGSEYGMIGFLHSFREEPIDGIIGSFYKFLNIDPSKPWLELRERKPIDFKKEKLKSPIPEYLKPDLKQIPFIFYPKIHRIFFKTEYAPSTIKKILEGLSIREEIQKKFGEVFITIETSQEAIERILLIPIKTKLEIFITMPNDDEIGELEEEFLENLEEQRIKKAKIEYSGNRRDSLNFNKKTIAMMKIAKSNGWVKAEGYDSDFQKKIIESTDPHPLIEKDYYDPNIQTEYDAINEIAQKIMSKIRNYNE